MFEPQPLKSRAWTKRISTASTQLRQIRKSATAATLWVVHRIGRGAGHPTLARLPRKVGAVLARRFAALRPAIAPASAVSDEPKARFRTVFMSDLHLGALGSRPELILGFLEKHRAEKYVLVGDILDLWQPGLVYWSKAEQAVVDHFAALHRDGAEIIYISGNHDPRPTDAVAHSHMPVEPRGFAVHQTLEGRRYLIVHGDAQDLRLFQAALVTRFFSRVDYALRSLDQRLSYYSGRPASPQRSVIEYILSSVNAVLYPSRAHERRLVDLARDAGMDGVICGHYHLAALHDAHGLTYANCGDWVDSFTALAEDFDGRLCQLGGRVPLARAVQPTAQPKLAAGRIMA